MSKIKNRKEYKYNVDLIKYSEYGLRKKCKGCVEEFIKTTQIAESFDYNNIIGNRNKGNKLI